MVGAGGNRGNAYITKMCVFEIVTALDVDVGSCNREVYFDIVALSRVEEQEETGSCNVGKGDHQRLTDLSLAVRCTTPVSS